MKKWKERALQYGRMYLSVAEKRDVLQAQVANLTKQLAGRDKQIDALEADKEALNVVIMGLQADLRWMREQRDRQKCVTCKYWGFAGCVRGHNGNYVRYVAGIGGVVQHEPDDTFSCSEWREREP